MDDPLRAALPGERWSIRRRLPDSSATDLVGWVLELDADRCRVSPAASADPVVIERSSVLAARRAPAAAGGPAPGRTSAAALEQIAMPAWVADHEPLGEWTLRSGGGFTSRANSALAVGDPGRPVAAAAAEIAAYADRRGARPWAQVVVDGPEDRALQDLGWRPVYVEVDVLAVRLSDLLADMLPDPTVAVGEDLSAFWSAYPASRPYDAEPTTVSAIEPLVRRILDGIPPRAFGTVTVGGEVISIGRGHLSAGWLGLSSIWTRPDQRRRGWATKMIIALGHWAAWHGARWAYLQVASENHAAITAYEQLRFRTHHRYRYLAAPD